MLKILTRAPGLARGIALKVGESLTIGDGDISGIYSGGALAARDAMTAQERARREGLPYGDLLVLTVTITSMSNVTRHAVETMEDAQNGTFYFDKAG